LGIDSGPRNSPESETVPVIAGVMGLAKLDTSCICFATGVACQAIVAREDPAMVIGSTLRKIRGDLGYEEAYVARRLGVDVVYLQAIETGRRALDSKSLSVFSDLYGLDLDRLWTQEVDPGDSEALRLLFLRNTGVSLPERTREAIARASLIAKQYVELGNLLDMPSAYRHLRSGYRHEGEYQGVDQTWRIGEDLGLRVRDDLDLGREPIRSIRELAEKRLGLLIVHANLRSSNVAACSFSNERTGPVVVVNLAGENSRPWRWRFTVAHEICHILFDELSQTELGSITGYSDQEDDEFSDAIEKRANSFAITLLAPKDGVRRHLSEMHSTDLAPSVASDGTKTDLAGQVRALMDRWGLNFKAARYRMQHVDRASRPTLDSLTGVDTKESDVWLTAEEDPLDTFFPCPTVPEDRRGAFARRVVQAFAAGTISQNRLVSLLEVAPDDPLDQLVSLVDELDRE
jgi:transcriptional regulator with XRE-family HTH domain